MDAKNSPPPSGGITPRPSAPADLLARISEIAETYHKFAHVPLAIKAMDDLDRIFSEEDALRMRAVYMRLIDLVTRQLDLVDAAASSREAGADRG